LLMRHSNAFTPLFSPVAVTVFAVKLLKVAVPDTTCHWPVPTRGMLPEKVVVALHTAWLVLTTAVLGLASLCTVRVAELLGQTPLLICHTKAFAPTLRPLAVTVGRMALFKVEVPLSTDQLPVPTAGVLPLRVALPAHTAKLLTTVAVEGGRSLCIDRVAVDAGQIPLAMFH
jgi:hypothetical protein